MTAPPLPYRVVLRSEGTADAASLVQAAVERGESDHGVLSTLCERAIRNHDPCISCSTHSHDLTVERT